MTNKIYHYLGKKNISVGQSMHSSYSFEYSVILLQSHTHTQEKNGATVFYTTFFCTTEIM